MKKFSTLLRCGSLWKTTRPSSSMTTNLQSPAMTVSMSESIGNATVTTASSFVGLDARFAMTAWVTPVVRERMASST